MNVRRRLAAILSADVVGYSRLMGADEAGTLERLKTLRAEAVDPVIAAHGGRIVKLMGDGALVEFASVVGAVDCAVEIQHAVAEANGALAEDRRIVFRIGVNLGDVIVDGDDIYGDGVNVAARLQEIAEPGGVCVSGGVYDQVKGKVEAAFEDMGAQQVKNIAEPVRVYRVAVAGGDADAMTTTTTNPPLPDKPSIAVLPFVNMSGDPEQEYFSDGITEDIITALSQVRWLFVIARNSTFAFKGKSADIRMVAKQLGVRYVLEGSVRKDSNRIRINAQLIDASSGNHVWAQRYDRQLQDIFDLQDEMTETIVAAVEPELASMERERASRKPPEDLNAWECYQRGVRHIYRFNKDDNEEAQKLFRRAVEIDPNFARGYAGLADAQYFAVLYGYSGSHAKTLQVAIEAAQRAVNLDNKDAGARFSLGRIYYMRREHDSAIFELETATALNPSYADGYYGLGASLMFAGRSSEAIDALQNALRLSPHDHNLWIFFVCLSLAHINLGDLETALKWAKSAVREPSTEITANVAYAATLGRLGMEEEGKRAVTELLRRKPEFSKLDLHNLLPYRDEADFEQIFEGLRKAGLEV